MVSAYEFQVVIFAGGKGSRMEQLLFGKPKCLLPIANKPMIQYPLEMLIRSDIKEAFIIVLDNEEETIKSTIHKLNLDIVIKYVAISSRSDSATADSLRSMKEKIDKDILILSCDIITDLKLTSFIQLYRLKNPTFLCLLSSFGSEKENLIPARKLNLTKAEFDIIGHDAKEPNRLVFFEPDEEFEDNAVPLKRSFLEQCPNFRLQTNLQDVHLYLFKRWILNYLIHKDNISSIKADLVPSIVRKQFRKPPNRGPVNDSAASKSDTRDDEKHLLDFVETPELYKILDSLEMGDLSADPVPQPYPASTVQCFAQTVGPDVTGVSYCIRANNWVRFCEANRVILAEKRAAGVKPSRSEAIKSHVDGLVGANTTIGEKCTIKRTVIGANCKIGNKVKLTNCILLDGVTIEENSILQGTVVCFGSSVGVSGKITDCIVGPGQVIAALSQHTNESLIQEMVNFDDGGQLII